MLKSMPSRREVTSKDATFDHRSTRLVRAFASRHAKPKKQAGAEIYSDAFREGYDSICTIVAGLKQYPGRVFTQIPYVSTSRPKMHLEHADDAYS